jgi:hypothetical protein
MPEITDITDSEHWIIETRPLERYGHKVEIQLADSEIRLMTSGREKTSSPVAYWNEAGCNFVIFKNAERKYLRQFFYPGSQQYGSGAYEYNHLTGCIVSLLRNQADHSAMERGEI